MCYLFFNPLLLSDVDVESYARPSQAGHVFLIRVALISCRIDTGRVSSADIRSRQISVLLV